MAYNQVTFVDTTEEINGILTALLQEMGYEGFEEVEGAFKAYIPASSFNETEVKELAARLRLEYSCSELPDANWNSLWESSFEPVIIENFCRIRADFHEPSVFAGHDIVVTPKMSFGTGHHATTFMMIGQMKEMDFAGKRVLDFGTGTGVLAILAVKLGAAGVTAVDNDEWSITNAGENFRTNNAMSIELTKADNAASDGVFDIILANITRNVILDNFASFITHLADGGILLLSGLLQPDEPHVQARAADEGLKLEERMVDSNWVSLRYRR